MSDRQIAAARKAFWNRKRDQEKELVASTESATWFRREYAEKYGSY